MWIPVVFHVLWRQSHLVHPSGYLAAGILANCHQGRGVLFNRSLVHLDSQILLSDLRPLTSYVTTLHCVAVFLAFENKYVKLWGSTICVYLYLDQNVLSRNTSRSFLQPSRILPSLAFTRYYSKDAPAIPEEVSNAVPASEPLSNATENVSPAAEVASSNFDPIHTPLQYGDLSALDLCHWSPAGIIQWTMEIINTMTHLPWFWTIVAGTVFWRVITIPVSAIVLRNNSRLLPHQGEIMKITAEMQEANRKADYLQRQKTALKLKAVYDKAGISPLLGFLGPLVQLPVSLGLFFGIKRMCAVPVEQMKWSGFDIIPDLTIADPTYILPALLVALVNMQISFGAVEMDVKSRPTMAHVMNGFRVLTILGFGVTASLPAVSRYSDLCFHHVEGFGQAVTLSIVTATLTLLLQTLAFQWRPIRRWLEIRELPEKQKLPSMRESMNWIIENMRKRVEEAKHLEAQRDKRARASDQMKEFQETRRKK